LTLPSVLILIVYLFCTSKLFHLFPDPGPIAVGLLLGVPTISVFGFITAAALDHVRGKRLRARTGSLELEQMLHDAASLWLPPNRARFLRWTREQGKLRPTPHGQRVLRDLQVAIERDFAARSQPAFSAQPDSAWTKDVIAFYREHGNRRRGLADWHGDTLDELSRLAEQLQLRVGSRALA
jgi:hypothetical protein